MEKVLPLRTAPSQMMASHSCRRHQVSTFFCLGENRMISAVLPPPVLGSLHQGTAQSLSALSAAIQKSPQGL